MQTSHWFSVAVNILKKGIQRERERDMAFNFKSKVTVDSVGTIYFFFSSLTTRSYWCRKLQQREASETKGICALFRFARVLLYNSDSSRGFCLLNIAFLLWGGFWVTGHFMPDREPWAFCIWFKANRPGEHSMWGEEDAEFYHLFPEKSSCTWGSRINCLSPSFPRSDSYCSLIYILWRF